MSSIVDDRDKPYDENPNIDWAMRFVDELAHGGLTDVCISPGSRSTPLTLAFSANPKIKVYRHLDERSAGFFALGIALAKSKPVAIVCTSGTATANLHPAIIEAQMSQIPLLILTADRPHELRHSGANQTIDQVKMFGDHVLWSVDIALPQPDAPPEVTRSLQNLAVRAIARCNGLSKGPVHMNFPFRKPLEPDAPVSWPSEPDAVESHELTRQFEHGRIHPTQKQIDVIAKRINQHARGLIICGPRCATGDFPAAAIQLAEKADYPILADPLSGIRFGASMGTTTVLGAYETFLQSEQITTLAPDLIIRFGSVPTSKWLNSYLNKLDATYHLHVRESGMWADQNHTTSHFLQVNPTLFCQQILPAIMRTGNIGWQSRWQQLETKSWAVINKHLAKWSFDGSFVATLMMQLPPNTKLFSGNSLAIRHIDQFGQPQEKDLFIYANRGASGIDGNISTGLGIATTSSKPTVLLVGDVTFFHDSNGLLAIKQLAMDNVIIVLLNNNGGGIFRRLPIAEFEPPFEELFLTPHDLDFEPLASMYGLNHQVATDLVAFEEIFAVALSSKSSTLIELQTNSHEDDQLRRQIIGEVKSHLQSLMTKEPIN